MAYMTRTGTGLPFGLTGKLVHGIRASAPCVYDVDRYERTVFGISTPDDGLYLLDVFRVSGGKQSYKAFPQPFRYNNDWRARSPNPAEVLTRELLCVIPALIT